MSGIFISYRRSASKHLARLIFQELRTRGYDVFLDVNTIDSGEFDRIILNQIAARPHFLLILSEHSLERCVNEGDWLRREIEEAFRLNRNIVPIFDEGFNVEQEKQYLPEPIRSALPRLNAPPYSHYYFDAFIDTICNRFLKQPTYEVVVTPTPAVERQEVERRIEQATQILPAPKRPSSLEIMPQPFEWIDILPGRVTLVNTWDSDERVLLKKNQPQAFYVLPFVVAKYPVTNGQFAKFIDSGGYDKRDYWIDEGWKAKVENKWIEPLYWRDEKWNGETYPVVGVSWYEALAFCFWLSDITDERIMLPTEQQWQRAAQGESNYAYPWGNEWDNSYCNYRMKPFESDVTTPVTQYQGKGDSPFKVVDMSGNVWEWCLTKYYSGENDINGLGGGRALRGGSWNSEAPDYFRADFRNWNLANFRFNNWGFRCVRL